MPDNSPQDQPPAYTFLGISPADELLEIAHLYHKEAKHCLRAHTRRRPMIGRKRPGC